MQREEEWLSFNVWIKNVGRSKGSNKFPRILFTTAPSYQKFFAFYSVSSIWHVQGLGDITTEGRIETGVIKRLKDVVLDDLPPNDSFDRSFRGIPPSRNSNFELI